MPTLFQVLSLCADLAVLLFVAYYFLKFNTKEKDFEKKENKADREYHEIVDDALTKERKIIDDATHAADQIITGAHYVNKETKQEVYDALQKMGIDIRKETEKVASDFLLSYQHALRGISDQSLTGYKDSTATLGRDLEKEITQFHETTLGLQTDMQKRIKEFHEKRLTELQKELDEYKRTSLTQAHEQIANIVRDASQEVLNKSISLEEHQKLVIDAFEKAKTKGAFD